MLVTDDSQSDVTATASGLPAGLKFDAKKMVITGDALFRGSIGRTDLPGGDYRLLIDKLHTRILTLPDDYQVLPGHGDLSTVGEERRYNGFLV